MQPNGFITTISSVLVMLGELSRPSLEIRCKISRLQVVHKTACDLYSIILFTANENKQIIPPITFHHIVFVYKVISEQLFLQRMEHLATKILLKPLILIYNWLVY